MNATKLGELNGAWSLLFRIALIVFPAWAGWMSLYTIRIDNRLVAVESSRFTSSDGQQLYRELGMKADKDDVPPEWLKTKVKEIKDQVVDLHKEVSQIREQLARQHP